MVTLTEIESLAFKLPQSDRAKLAADLLDSLPSVIDDEVRGFEGKQAKAGDLWGFEAGKLTQDDESKIMIR